jgi:2-polyprenyl-3-methyl-5-hydroxy-6-metoxy-1,4-benzoquinol methylase
MVGKGCRQGRGSGSRFKSSPDCFLANSLYRFRNLAGAGGAFMPSVKHISRRFDSRAIHYDNPLTAFVGERELRAIRKLVPPGAKVLDYGCGTGRTTIDLLRCGCIVTAYDVSLKMLAVAESKAAKLGYEAEFITDAAGLNGRVWPIVTCIGVMDYYRDPVPLLKILRAYLQPSSRLIVTFPNALSPLAWMYIAGSRLTVPATARTPRFVKQSVAQAGFQVVGMAYAFPALAPLGLTLVIALNS